MTLIVEAAPAKINLALHVTGRREDGYHLLDSLVTFSESGDQIVARPAQVDEFTISGPFSTTLDPDSGNLVIRARDLLRMAIQASGGETPPVSLHLEKNLPVASGIGGGSADAAATIRALLRLWNLSLPSEMLEKLALSLGADVPMCLAGRPAIARGVGEALTPVTTLPSLNLLLVNPLKPVATPEIFRRLLKRDNPPMDALPGSFALSDWSDFLAEQRNDLEPAARELVPEIRIIQTLLSLTGAQLGRMSGSGATCFGLYDTREAARAAERNLRSAQPGWFVKAVATISGDDT